jgi:hypothetical protein
MVELLPIKTVYRGVNLRVAVAGREDFEITGGGSVIAVILEFEFYRLSVIVSEFRGPLVVVSEFRELGVQADCESEITSH